ncbi:MAG TPA: hypothetical protein VNR18_13480 [Hyphomicrobiales bacterium]|nr:hypothetical protein [Hyphomicrobiales bacterium]
MSELRVRNIYGKDGQPVAFPTGIRVGGPAGGPNAIAPMGGPGAGLGVCPGPLPLGLEALYGHNDPMSDTFGNYQFSDGSVMCWIPAFFYKFGTGANGLPVNTVDIKDFSEFTGVAAANAAGYALHRAFYDGGAIQPGVFIDKYHTSNNAGIASSLRNGDPLSSSSGHNPFSGLNGAPANNLAGAIAATKTRGANFFPASVFIFKALAMLSLGHGLASSAPTYCAWWHPAYPFPKGCNNSALGDTNDPDLLFVSDGFENCCKTGSANLFARTTHNGQNSGVADVNGCIWDVAPGLTMDNADPAVGHFYVLKTSARMRDITGGNSAATDLWGSAGLAALYDDLGLMSDFTSYALNFSDRYTPMGSASKVFSEAVSGLPWQMTGAGIPLVSGGSNRFGSDGLGDYSTNDMIPRCGGTWNNGGGAGVWALYFINSRSTSDAGVGVRAALYL